MKFSTVCSNQPAIFCPTLILFVKGIGDFISQFSNLETLTFQGLLVPISWRLPIKLEWIRVALLRVTPTVRKFTMEIVTNQLSRLHAIPWSAIDEILSDQLRSVTIVEILLAKYSGVDNLLEDVYQDMERRLPLAAQRGVLRCSAVGEHPI